MESKPKRRAMGSSESESKSLLVRLSDLPDQIAHQILSFLTVTDLFRLCCVSKRWGTLSVSAPCLNFDGIPSGWKSSCYERLQMMSYLDRFFFRGGVNKVKSFRLKWERHSTDDDENLCICLSEHDRLHTWINCAVRCNVETLDLKMDLYGPEEVPFPSSVFLCGTLRSLVVDMNFTLIRTPSFGFSSNLTKLKLTNVVIEDEQFFKWLSCSCKYIQELHLNQVHGIEIISVESSSLKIFEICGVFNAPPPHLSISGEKLQRVSVAWSIRLPRQSSFNMCAPNLKRFCCCGNLINNLSLGKLRGLVAAILLLRPDADEGDKAYEVLHSLWKVRALTLDEATIKAAYKDEEVRVQLGEVWFLQMTTGGFTDDLVPAVVRLLRGIPKLCNLYIEYEPTSLDHEYDSSGFDMENWKIQNLGFISEVKDVTVELSTGSYGIEFARYILLHAASLVKMVIKYLPEQSNDIRKLKESEMVSNPVVIFEEYKKSLR